MASIFWGRYEKLCLENGYKPASTQAAEVLGTSRGAISAWKGRGNLPQPEFAIRIADIYGVSTDYLFGRTDDPTDYPKADVGAAAKIDDEKKAIALQKLTETKATREEIETIDGFDRLDPVDKGKVSAYIQGILAQEKYQNGRRH